MKNNTQVRLTMGFFCALFLAMLVYLVHFELTREQDMVNNSYNSRQQLLISRNYRGTIYSRDGDVLAQSRVNQDGEDREYPYKNMFAHIVGYSGKGRLGIEALANYYLINTHTPLSKKVDNDLAGVKNPGDNVYTTLDVDIQKVANDQLNVYRGAIVVTEVKTGNVLALVSHPDFDPNRIEEEWEDLVEDEDSTVLLNRATQGLYPPGSTFKIVTALEYIRENPTTYEQYSYQCNGTYSTENNTISCFHGTKHGKVDLAGSMANSCNCSFANIGVGLDKKAFSKTLDSLLFGKELPIALSSVKSSTNVEEGISNDEIVQVAFGQGKTQITPMHLNMITSSIANKGLMVKPRFLDRVENDEGDVVTEFRTEEYGRVMSEEEAAILTELLKAVVEEGNCQKLKGLEYTAAGKTGSAEYNSNKEDSHAWFTGFAPAEDPEVCVTIVVEGAGTGGDYALPIAKRLFDAYFKQK